MPLPSEADQVVIEGFLLDEITGGGLAGEVKSEPIALPGQAPVPMVLDAVSHAHIQTRPRVTTPDPTTGYWALMALATNDPDLEAYGGRRVTLPGQTARDIEVPYNATSKTVTTAMAAQLNPGNVAGKPQVGDTVRALWFHQAAGYVAPTPTNAYLTSQQTIDLIAQAIGEGGGGSGGGDLPEYSATAQTAAVTATGLVGKTTRFNTTSAAISQSLPAATAGRVVAIGWDAGTNALTLTANSGDVIGSGSATSVPVPVVNAVVQLHCTTTGRWRVVGGHLPSSYVVFNSANTDTTGAATGSLYAVDGVGPLHHSATAAPTADGQLLIWNHTTKRWVPSDTTEITPADIGAQPADADLTAFAALDATTAGALATDGSGWVRKTYAQLKSALGLNNVSNTADTDKPVSTAQQAAIDARGFAPPRPPSGAYFYTSGVNSVSTSATNGVGTLRLVPWLVHRSLPIDRLGAEVTAAGDAGSKVRIVIYSDNGNGYPGALLLDAGSINGDSATVQELTVAQTLPPGLYWVGVVVQNVTTTQPTLTITQGTGWTPPVTMLWRSNALPAAGTGMIGLSATGITGTPVATFPSNPNAAGSAPRVFARAA